MQTKKPWSKPEVRDLPVTDEILELFARQAKEETPLPIKRTK